MRGLRCFRERWLRVDCNGHAAVGYGFQQFIHGFQLDQLPGVLFITEQAGNGATHHAIAIAFEFVDFLAGAQDVLCVFARRFEQANGVAYAIDCRYVQFGSCSMSGVDLRTSYIDRV
jgi:hypothetical protein